QNRDHRKIIVIDGEVGFTGGINVSGTYASASTIKPGPDRGVDEGWRDTHVQIEGPAVAQLQALFFETWRRTGGAIDCCEEAYFRAAEASGSASRHDRRDRQRGCERPRAVWDLSRRVRECASAPLDHA